MFKTVDCAAGAARELRFWREASKSNRYHLLEWPISKWKGKWILFIMADAAGKFAEDRIPFNFFKKVPKIVRIWKVFSVVSFKISNRAKKRFCHGEDVCGLYISRLTIINFQELHAHINGSISAETIEKLIKRKSDQVKENCLVSKWQTTIQKGDKRDLDE